MDYFINLFFVFSCLGFILEQSLLNLFHKRYNSSLLKGPWTIVYGIASLIILFLGKKVSSLKLNKFWRFSIFFISCFVILSLLELISGLLIEAVLGIVYWDYSNMPLHLGKYICVPVSLVWCIYAVILNYLIYPWAKKLIKKIPKVITFILIFFFLIDICYTTFQFLYYK